jgi:hypothetical protein
MVRENPGMRVSQLYRDVTDGEPGVSQIDTPSAHASAYDEALGRVHPRISETAVQSAKSHVRGRRNIFSTCVFVGLAQHIRQYTYEWWR